MIYHVLVIAISLIISCMSANSFGAPPIPPPRDITEASPEQKQQALEASLAQLDSNPEALKEKKEVATQEAKPESEIPVFKSPATKKAEISSDPFTRMSLGLGVVLFVLGGTFIFFKRRAQKGSIKRDGTEIRVVTQHHLGPKKSLAVVRVSGEAMLIGVTDNNITLIKALTLLDEELPQDVPTHFNQSLEQAEADDSADDFAIQGVRDVVSDRIRSMRNLM